GAGRGRLPWRAAAAGAAAGRRAPAGREHRHRLVGRARVVAAAASDARPGAVHRRRPVPARPARPGRRRRPADARRLRRQGRLGGGDDRRRRRAGTAGAGLPRRGLRRREGDRRAAGARPARRMSRTAKAALGMVVLAAVAVSLLRRRQQSDPEQLLRSYYDAWTDGDGDAVRDLLAEDYCGHVHTISGTEEHGAGVASHAEAFESVEFELEDVLPCDGEVAARVTMRARHRETERDAETTGIVILRLEDGRIAEEWSSWDYLGLAEQLGLSNS